MKILISYASKTGTAKACATRLSELVEGSELCDLTEKTPDISAYDGVIVGCGIRMGRFHKSARKFIAQNASGLKKKTFGVFICNGFAQCEEYFKNEFSDGELDGAIKASFGGELELEKLKGTDKFIAKMVAKSDAPLPQINYEAIEEFADKFAKAVKI